MSEQEQTGEVNVQASSDRRKITLDPIREKKLQIYCKEVESTTPCGFRVNWVDGECDGEHFQLDCGAGVGSPWIMFQYKGRDYCISAKDILAELFIFANEKGDK